MQRNTKPTPPAVSRSTARRGFTIVELLIVIVIVAILATITVVAYRGIQARARDSQRLQDAKTLEKALRIYLINNGDLPVHTGVGGSSDWERSSSEPEGQFLEALATSGAISKVPIDPTNTSAYQYRYHRYNAGSNGCDAAKGRFGVLQISDMETSGRPHAQSPGHSCSNGVVSRNWATEADYVFAIYENE